MPYDVRVWSLDNGRWRASVNWNGERLFGESDNPALAIVELGIYWQNRSKQLLKESEQKHD